MTDKERIYNYLDGRISHRSFRKWLLSVPDLSNYFGDKDANELSELIKIYSRVGEIRSILLKHIDNAEFEIFSIYNYINHQCSQEKDVLETIDHISTLATRVKDEGLKVFASQLQNYLQNVPRETEKTYWNTSIFESKRAILSDVEPNVNSKILELKKHYYIDINSTKTENKNSFIDKLKNIINGR